MQRARGWTRRRTAFRPRQLLGNAFIAGLGAGALGGLAGLVVVFVAALLISDGVGAGLVILVAVVAIPIAAVVGALAGAALATVLTAALWLIGRTDLVVASSTLAAAGATMLIMFLLTSNASVSVSVVTAAVGGSVNARLTLSVMRSSTLVNVLSYPGLR